MVSIFDPSQRATYLNKVFKFINGLFSVLFVGIRGKNSNALGNSRAGMLVGHSSYTASCNTLHVDGEHRVNQMLNQTAIVARACFANGSKQLEQTGQSRALNQRRLHELEDNRQHFDLDTFN